MNGGGRHSGEDRKVLPRAGAPPPALGRLHRGLRGYAQRHEPPGGLLASCPRRPQLVSRPRHRRHGPPRAEGAEAEVAQTGRVAGAGAGKVARDYLTTKTPSHKVQQISVRLWAFIFSVPLW